MQILSKADKPGWRFYLNACYFLIPRIQGVKVNMLNPGWLVACLIFGIWLMTVSVVVYESVAL